MNCVTCCTSGSVCIRRRARAGAAVVPTKPVRIVVPYPPGGGTDMLTRLVGKYLGER